MGWVALESSQSMDNILVKLSLKAVKLLWLIFLSQKEIIKRPCV